MIYKVYAVKDRGTGAFMNPFFLVADGQAVRGFTDQINTNKEDNQTIYAHPDDFDLWRLAEFDTDTGVFTGSPEQLILGKQVAVRS